MTWFWPFPKGYTYPLVSSYTDTIYLYCIQPNPPSISHRTPCHLPIPTPFCLLLFLLLNNPLSPASTSCICFGVGLYLCDYSGLESQEGKTVTTSNAPLASLCLWWIKNPIYFRIFSSHHHHHHHTYLFTGENTNKRKKAPAQAFVLFQLPWIMFSSSLC